jgi:transcriptional regulator with XRE-family HTH domain
MTAEEVTRIRTRMGLNQVQFAELLGVAASTVSRWERLARIDPMQARILEVIVVLEKQDAETWEQTCGELRQTLLVRGGLFALYRLLGRFFQSPS